MNTDEPKHPPLNTPLSAFTAAMLDALPVGSAFGPTSEFGHVVTKRADGVWCGEMVSTFEEDSANLLRFWGDEDPPLTLNPTRVGPEQASEPELDATLPDPWPNMLIEWVDGDWIRRDRVKWSFTNADANTRVTVEDHPHKVDWTPNVVQEVRTPDGVTLWKRPAAKVTE